MIALIFAGSTAVVSVFNNQRYTQAVEHTYLVENQLVQYGSLTERLEATRRGFLLNRSDLFYPLYLKTAHELPVILDRIAFLTSDNIRQQRRIALLRRVAADHGTSIARSMAEMQSSDAATRSLADFGVDSSAHSMRTIRSILADMLADEANLLRARRTLQNDSAIRLFSVLGLTGLLVLLVVSGGLWIILRYTRDLNRTQAELRGLNENLEGAVAERTAELQRANDEIQRFAYIVSHDLRSPLVNVMGFTAELEATIAPLAELIDRVEAEMPAMLTTEARLAAREDLPEAIGFIRTSTQKMDRLINAILRLSREGRRPIAPVRIDMDAMVYGVRDALQHQLKEAEAEVEIVSPLPMIVSDRLAIEQIVSNLTENAIKYLKPGRLGRITISGRREGTRAIFEIADNGRGIDPRDHERIFDLFRRSGRQDKPGEGLGLAHVRALAYRLGGVISCQSALDEGATFRLSLPVELASDQGTKT